MTSRMTNSNNPLSNIALGIACGLALLTVGNTSNPDVAEQVIADWSPRKETQQFVSVGVNDGSANFCECNNCRALDGGAGL